MTEMLSAPEHSGLPDWSRAYGEVPSYSACLRRSPEDFVVVEKPVCLPDGTGEHVWLLVRKRLRNTQEVAKVIARWAGVKIRDVSYAGLKDRVAVTEQWFSVQLPGKKAPELGDEWPDGVEILELHRHSRKLRRGALQGNDFRIVLRDCSGDFPGIERRLDLLAQHGVPNYFGEQRFGWQGGNLEKARRMLEDGQRIRDRNLQSLIISAARSYVFNLVLSDRVKQQSWLAPEAGDLIMLDGSQSTFRYDQNGEDISQRLATGDVHLSGPMPGRGSNELAVSKAEQAILAGYSVWIEGLMGLRVDAGRRSLRVLPRSLRYEWLNNQDLCLRFSLPPGSYATAVLREIVSYSIGKTS